LPLELCDHSSNLVVGVADPLGFFGDSFVFAVNHFFDAAVVWASMIEVDLGEELRIRSKGGRSRASKALGLKNPIAGLWRFLCLGKKFQGFDAGKIGRFRQPK
jgi:hypothetical protein